MMTITKWQSCQLTKAKFQKLLQFEAYYKVSESKRKHQSACSIQPIMIKNIKYVIRLISVQKKR